jgi:hypothetical protein
MKLIPVGEFKFQNYNGVTILAFGEKPPPAHVDLTCKNHLTGRWSSKNPHQRGLHWNGWEDGFTLHPEYGWNECGCPFSDMVVIVEDEEGVVPAKYNMLVEREGVLGWDKIEGGTEK